MTGARPDLAGGLCLAATPAFGLMALLTALREGGMAGLCGAGPGPAMGGMAAMYLLMALFHAAPWLRLLAGRRGGADAGRAASQ